MSIKEINSSINEVNRLRLELSRSRKYLVALFALLVLLSGVALKQAGNAIVTVVPAGFTDSFTVTRDAPDVRYIEMMSIYLSNLNGNYTPETVAYSINQLLTHVDSEFYSFLSEELSKKKDFVIDNKVSSSFSISSMSIDQKKLKAVVKGVYLNWIDGQSLSEKNKGKQVTILIDYKYSAGSLTVASFKEVSNAK
jgi:type IV conjugative transfer system protein TraE